MGSHIYIYATHKKGRQSWMAKPNPKPLQHKEQHKTTSTQRTTHILTQTNIKLYKNVSSHKK